jgi:carbon storage regulator
MALVLTRRRGERIMIGDDITIEVKEVHGNHVTLAIDAPKTVQVDREEIYERKRLEQQATLPEAEGV